MAKTIVVSTGSIDYKEIDINNRTGYREITITSTGTDPVTGTITAPSGWVLEDPDTGALVTSYNFSLDGTPLATFTTRIFTFDIAAGTADFAWINFGFAVDNYDNYYTCVYDDNVNKMYLVKYNNQMIFQSALCLGVGAEPGENYGKVACSGSKVFVVYPTTTGGSKINITKLEGSTMTIELEKDYDYTLGSNYPIYLTASDSDDNYIAVAGYYAISGTNYGIFMKLNVSDLTVATAIRNSGFDFNLSKCRIEGNNFYFCGEEVDTLAGAAGFGYGDYNNPATNNSRFGYLTSTYGGSQGHFFYDVAVTGGEVYYCGKFWDNGYDSGRTFGLIGKYTETGLAQNLNPCYGIKKTADANEKIYIYGIRFYGDYCYAVGYTENSGSIFKGFVLKLDTTGSPWTITTAKYFEYVGSDADDYTILTDLQEVNNKFIATGYYKTTPGVPLPDAKKVIFVIDPINNDDLNSVPTNFSYNNVTSQFSIDNSMGLGGSGSSSIKSEVKTNITINNRTWSGGGATDSGTIATYDIG